MEILKNLVDEICKVFNSVLSIATGGNVFTGIIGVIGPLQDLGKTDWKAVEQNLLNLTAEGRKQLEVQLVSGINVDDNTKATILSGSLLLERAIVVVQTEIKEVEDVVKLINDVKKLIGA